MIPSSGHPAPSSRVPRSVHPGPRHSRVGDAPAEFPALVRPLRLESGVRLSGPELGDDVELPLIEAAAIGAPGLHHEWPGSMASVHASMARHTVTISFIIAVPGGWSRRIAAPTGPERVQNHARTEGRNRHRAAECVHVQDRQSIRGSTYWDWARSLP
jgi:hypothetical protein